MKKKLLLTNEITEDGTVIDHLPLGKGHVAVYLLGLEPTPDPGSGERIITYNLLRNVIGDDPKSQPKDMVKIYDISLTDLQMKKLALLCEEQEKITVTEIRGGKIVKKDRLNYPDEIFGLLKCPEPDCTVNKNGLRSYFNRSRTPPGRVRCGYCETSYRLEALEVI